MNVPLKPFLSIVCAFLMISHWSCNDVSGNPDEKESAEGCANVICTLEFRTILVSIKNQDQSAVALDSFEVIDMENGTDRTLSLTTSEFEAAKQSGAYPIANDGSLDVNQQKKLQFKGMKNGVEVVNKEYIGGTDCCHISLVSGDLKVVL